MPPSSTQSFSELPQVPSRTSTRLLTRPHTIPHACPSQVLTPPPTLPLTFPQFPRIRTLPNGPAGRCTRSHTLLTPSCMGPLPGPCTGPGPTPRCSSRPRFLTALSPPHARPRTSSRISSHSGSTPSSSRSSSQRPESLRLLTELPAHFPQHGPRLPTIPHTAHHTGPSHLPPKLLTLPLTASPGVAVRALPPLLTEPLTALLGPPPPHVLPPTAPHTNQALPTSARHTLGGLPGCRVSAPGCSSAPRPQPQSHLPHDAPGPPATRTRGHPPAQGHPHSPVLPFTKLIAVRSP